MKTLVLIRHGKLQIFERYSKLTLVNGSNIKDILQDYDTSGLSVSSNPSNKLLSHCQQYDMCICSKLQRTADSFKRLGINQYIESDLLNEAQLPSGILMKMKFPLGFWAFLLRTLWFSGVSTNCESFRFFMKRMKSAQLLIESQFEQADTVLVMSHSFVNIVLKQLFLKKYWKIADKYGRSGYWSFVAMTSNG